MCLGSQPDDVGLKLKKSSKSNLNSLDYIPFKSQWQIVECIKTKIYIYIFVTVNSIDNSRVLLNHIFRGSWRFEQFLTFPVFIMFTFRYFSDKLIKVIVWRFGADEIFDILFCLIFRNNWTPFKRIDLYPLFVEIMFSFKN